MKGQYFSFDALMATLMFLTALMLMFSFWTFSVNASSNDLEGMRKEVIRISSLLISDSPQFSIVESSQNHLLLNDGNSIDFDLIRERVDKLNSTTKYCINVEYASATGYSILRNSCPNNVKVARYTIYRAVRVKELGYEHGTWLRISINLVQP